MNFRLYIKNFIQGIKNLYYWFPIIWHDRDWDYAFMFQIWQHKLKSMSTFYRTKGYHVGSVRNAELMEMCVRLIDRVNHEYYMSEPMGYIDTEIIFEPIEEEGRTSEIVVNESNDNLEEYYAKYPLVVNKISKTMSKGDRMFRYAVASENQKRAKDLLFKIMRDKYEKWWD